MYTIGVLSPDKAIIVQATVAGSRPFMWTSHTKIDWNSSISQSSSNHGWAREKRQRLGQRLATMPVHSTNHEPIKFNNLFPI